MGGGLVDDHLGIKGIYILIHEEVEGVKGRSGIGQRCSTFDRGSGDLVCFGLEMWCDL